MHNLKFSEYSDTKNPKYLVIFLHGYGANGENLLDLSYEFKNTLPEAHFISPNAVQPWEGGFPDCYQWFSLKYGLKGLDVSAMALEIVNSNNILQKFINHQLQRFSLKEENLFIIGFSQGAMMAIYQGLINKNKVAGVIGFSGRVILPEIMGQKTISKPEICLIHGQNDLVVPFENFLNGKEILQKNNFTFESHALDNLEHSIDIRGIRIAQNFIKKLQNQ